MIEAKNFIEEYGNFGVKEKTYLGVYPNPIVKGIFSDRVSVPTNPQSLLSGNIVNQLAFTGSQLILGHFKISYLIGTLTIYKSDGTSPNTTLSGNQGDICFGADGGKSYYCTGTTNWTAM